MKRLFLSILLLATLAMPVGANAVDLYVAQTAAGDEDGSSCANGVSVATHTASIGASATTVYLCGAITSAIVPPSGRTSGNVVTYTNYDDTTVIQGAGQFNLSGRDYITITGQSAENPLRWNANTGAWVYYSTASTNIKFQYCSFANMAAQQWDGIDGEGATLAQDWEFLNSVFYDATVAPAEDRTWPQDYIDFYNFLRIRIEGCTFGKTSHNSIALQNWSGTSQYAIIKNNIFANKYHTNFAAYYVDNYGDSLLIEGNKVHDAGEEYNTYPGFTDAGLGRLAHQGIKLTWDNVIVRNNELTNNGHNNLWGTTHRWYNNTSYGDIRFIQNSTVRTMTDVAMKNNLINVAAETDNAVFLSSEIGTNVFTYNSMKGDGSSEIRYEGTYKNTIFLAEDAWPTEWVDGTNLAISDPLYTNTATRDFTLQAGSSAIDAGTWLTQANGAAAGGSSTSLVVDDARYFFDGWSIPGATADYIWVTGWAAPIQISSINYGTNTITLSSAANWANDAYVYYCPAGVKFTGSAPDLGAYEYGESSPQNQAPVISSVLPGTTTLYTDGGAGWNQISAASTVTDPEGEAITYLWTFGIEYLTNGDMELPVSAEPPTSWTANNSTLDDSADPVHGGSQSIKVTDEGSYASAYQAITTEINAKYRVTAWGYRPTITGSQGMNIRVSSTGPATGNIQPEIAGSNQNTTNLDSWVQLTHIFTATTTTTYIALAVWGSIEDGSVYAYFDDVTVDQISTAADPGTITYPDPGSGYPVAYTVTLTATDASGASSSSSFVVTVAETSVDSFSDIIFWVNWDYGSWSSPTYTIGSIAELSQDSTGTIASAASVSSGTLVCPTGGDYMSFSITNFPHAVGRVMLDWEFNTWVDTAWMFKAFGPDADNFMRVQMYNTDEVYFIYEGNNFTDAFVTETSPVTTAETRYVVEVAWDQAAGYMEIFVNGVSKGSRSSPMDAWTDASTAIEIGEHGGFASAQTFFQVAISNDKTRDFYAIRDQLMLPSAPRIGSIGNTDINGTYGVGGALNVPVNFVDGNGAPKAVAATAQTSTLTTETDADADPGDLVLLHTSPANDVLGSTHWYSTTETAGQAIVAGMASADLAVTAVTDSGATIAAVLDLPAGENLSDNSAVVIDTTGATFDAINLCDSDGVAVADGPTYSTAGYLYFYLTTTENTQFMDGPLLNLAPTLVLDYGTSICSVHSGLNGTGTKIVFKCPLEVGDRATSLVLGETALPHGVTKIVDISPAENELTSYDYPSGTSLEAGTIVVLVPTTLADPLDIGSAGDFATHTAAIAGGFVANDDDFITHSSAVTEAGAVDWSGSDGSSGHPITVNGGGFVWTGSITAGDYWVFERIIHASTVTLGLGDTHQLSIIPSGSELVIPALATGCNVKRDIIAGTLTVSEDAAMTSTAVSGTVALANGKTLTAVKCYFAQSEAAIEAAGGIVTPTDCVFEVADFGFFGASDFHIKGTSVLRDAGANISEVTDIRGITIPQGTGYDVGPYEYNAAYVIMMGN